MLAAPSGLIRRRQRTSAEEQRQAARPRYGRTVLHAVLAEAWSRRMACPSCRAGVRRASVHPFPSPRRHGSRRRTRVAAPVSCAGAPSAESPTLPFRSSFHHYGTLRPLLRAPAGWIVPVPSCRILPTVCRRASFRPPRSDWVLCAVKAPIAKIFLSFQIVASAHLLVTKQCEAVRETVGQRNSRDTLLSQR